jgi:hypothetical protein
MLDFEYFQDLKKYTTDINEEALQTIVSYCGIALRGADSSLVATSDPKELATVRNGFAAKKLGLTSEAADAAMSRVTERMQAENRKSRVTFYYLLAEEVGKVDALKRKSAATVKSSSDSRTSFQTTISPSTEPSQNETSDRVMVVPL